MIKKIGVIILALIVVLLVVIQSRPPTYEVTRSLAMNAPAAIPYALVDDFHAWSQWSPWEKLDPAMQRSFEGPASGPGAIYRWKGNKDAGSGSMTITDVKANAKVGLDLEFIEPFPSKSHTTFDFAQNDKGTTLVTWRMSGANNFMAKAMSLVMNMDKMIGPDFEAGLQKLKDVSEQEATRRTQEATAQPGEPAGTEAPPAPAQ
jgi:hypothetical protein